MIEQSREAQPEADSSRAELDAFIYAVSHDLRAPIRAIRGFGQILEEDHLDKLDAEGKDCVGRILAASTKLSEMLDGLLVYSRLTRKTVARRPVDITEMAREIASSFEESGVCPPGVVTVADGLHAETDEQLLRLALEELIGNACRFSSEGQVRIEVGAADGSFYVADHGRGFKQEDAERIFKPFEKAHDGEGSGLGMGLTNVARIFVMLGGRLEAFSKPGEGSKFVFTLPEH